MLIIFGSLTTVDPGNIYETLSSCVKDRIRISLVALAAETKICRELCDKTGGATLPPSLLPSHRRNVLIFYTPRRYLWCRYERRSLQGPSLRTHPPSSPAAHRHRRRGQDECGPDDDGLPAAPAGHRTRGIVRVPRADARRGVSVPALWGASL